jgi:hypothetical protein
MIRTDYEKNLSTYVRSVDKDKLNTIIRACGIALRGLDAQYVSMSDPAEVRRVAVGFGAKKLGLSVAAVTKGLAAVDTAMKAERSKMRTTVYYLLAKETGTLGKLAAVAPKKAKTAKKVKKAKAAKVVKKTLKKAKKIKKVAKKAKRSKR